jgi:hypothetical protein
MNCAARRRSLSAPCPQRAKPRAIRYALSRWSALMRHAEDGMLEIRRVEMWRGDLGLA